MITEDYVSFAVAKLLKKKGFSSDNCHTAYDENGDFFWYGDYSKDRRDVIDAPTLQMAMKWLRRKYGLFIRITEDMIVNVYEWSVYQKNYGCRASTYVEDSYEQAEETAIKYCLENLI